VPRCGIMAHWLSLGVSGFRVGMAVSLVKDDLGLAETSRAVEGCPDMAGPDLPPGPGGISPPGFHRVKSTAGEVPLVAAVS
jgi:hypothetical protein